MHFVVPAGVRYVRHDQHVQLVVTAGDDALNGWLTISGWTTPSDDGHAPYPVVDKPHTELHLSAGEHQTLNLTVHEDICCGSDGEEHATGVVTWHFAAHLAGIEAAASIPVGGIAATDVSPSTGCSISKSEGSDSCMLQVSFHNNSDEVAELYLSGVACHKSPDHNRCDASAFGDGTDLLEVETPGGWVTAQTHGADVDAGAIPSGEDRVVAIRASLGDSSSAGDRYDGGIWLRLQPFNTCVTASYESAGSSIWGTDCFNG